MNFYYLIRYLLLLLYSYLYDFLNIFFSHILNSTNIKVEQSGSTTLLADQWWQLFDTKRKKFFYFNPHRQQTTWQRPANARTIKNDEKENIINGESKSITDEGEPVVVIPLASKLIERINSNLNLLKKSKRFLR
jgi:hypothetical protein